MNEDILKKIDEQSKRIDEIFISVEKTRKYIKWTVIITIILFVLPLIGLAFALPSYVNTLNSEINLTQ